MQNLFHLFLLWSLIFIFWTPWNKFCIQMRSWIGCESCVRPSSWWHRCTWTWWRFAAGGTPEWGYVSGRDPRVRVYVREGPQSQGMCQGGTPESWYVPGMDPRVRVCVRQGPQSQGMCQGGIPESGYVSGWDPRVRVCVRVGSQSQGCVRVRDPRVRVCARVGPQSQGMCQGGTPK